MLSSSKELSPTVLQVTEAKRSGQYRRGSLLRRQPKLVRISFFERCKLEGELIMIRYHARGAILKDDLKAKLNLAWRPERVYSRTYAHAIGVMCRGIGPIDRSGSTSEKAGHDARREIEIGKIK